MQTLWKGSRNIQTENAFVSVTTRLSVGVEGGDCSTARSMFTFRLFHDEALFWQ